MALFPYVTNSCCLVARGNFGRDAREASSGLVGTCAHGDKRRCDRMGCPTMPPVLGRKIVKRSQHLTVLGQALSRLRILPFIGGDEEVKRYRGTLAVGRHPDGLQALLGLRLQVFGQCVEHVGRLLHPTQLPTRRAVHVAQRLPATPCPIPQGPRLAPARARGF